ncbi:Type II secretory pathway ATPase GspE/PulE or T4P pilus assembly pathway ATPase PilB (PulE) [Eupransor demetentiae]|uniref:Type II secretory pathway ATPase GspE/PulE or T4P pilus assembly pathway ATPase PilB (PulE) n=1 Tax=Eupransor demetentiae TaxID=3109584 RepID=A0ABP0EMH7_9LACO|nr:Type II secretory pathway ATPase GspE/PulE or T4P pilus assembly pathway ATPase PilB (PulE) [Lactobacillaceae bacterium LMG 33000]
MQIEELLLSAHKRSSSDIYILPDGQGYRLGMQVQGALAEFKHLSQEEALPLIAAIKYRSQLNISEKRRPQLGRFDFQHGWVRVSTVGDFLERETVVLRLIQKRQTSIAWLNTGQYAYLQQEMPSAGLFLLTGPTGSGKTTTIYQLLRELDNRVVLTIEDPVEIHEPTFVQL